MHTRRSLSRKRLERRLWYSKGQSSTKSLIEAVPAIALAEGDVEDHMAATRDSGSAATEADVGPEWYVFSAL